MKMIVNGVPVDFSADEECLCVWCNVLLLQMEIKHRECEIASFARLLTVSLGQLNEKLLRATNGNG